MGLPQKKWLIFGLHADCVATSFSVLILATGVTVIFLGLALGDATMVWQTMDINQTAYTYLIVSKKIVGCRVRCRGHADNSSSC